MLKGVVGVFLALFAALVFAAVDVNKASAQELAQIKGIGPATAERIVEERAKSNFKDWDDFIARVKGVGVSKAATFSESGLTVQGKRYTPGSGDKKQAAKDVQPVKPSAGAETARKPGQ